ALRALRELDLDAFVARTRQRLAHDHHDAAVRRRAQRAVVLEVHAPALDVARAAGEEARPLGLVLDLLALDRHARIGTEVQRELLARLHGLELCWTEVVGAEEDRRAAG